MKIIDISWPISITMTAYKDKKCVSLSATKRFETYQVRETLITISSHTGTHIDAPAHFLADGATSDTLDPLCCSGAARVIDMTHIIDTIRMDDLKDLAITSDEIILFKTQNSLLESDAPFNPHFIYIEKDAASYLATLSIKAVGIDYLGIERNQPAHETHLAFMQHNIPIIEGLRLAQVTPGIYQLWCLPLKIKGLDGAPARALLIKA